jgi:hypothetical protein
VHSLLVIAVSLAGILAAVAVLAAWMRPEAIVAMLLRGPRLGNAWFDQPVDDLQLEVGRRLLLRLRVPMLVALAALAFVSGALLVLLRLGPGGVR